MGYCTLLLVHCSLLLFVGFFVGLGLHLGFIVGIKSYGKMAFLIASNLLVTCLEALGFK